MFHTFQILKLIDLDVKTFCDDMFFLTAFVKLAERYQQATPHLFCVKE